MADQLPGQWHAEVIRTLTSNPWFSVLLQTVTRPDGSKTPYYTIDFPGPAVGVVVRRNDHYLLIRQYRFIVNEFVWAIPSGGVHAGESLEEAAAREVLEETGYQVTKIQRLLHYYPSYGCGNQRFELFLAEDAVGPLQPFDATEVLEVRWFSREELLGLMLSNGVVDGLSLTPLALLLLQETMERGPRAVAARD
jgi:ADP-ribose pyrophosphatase